MFCTNQYNKPTYIKSSICQENVVKIYLNTSLCAKTSNNNNNLKNMIDLVGLTNIYSDISLYINGIVFNTIFTPNENKTNTIPTSLQFLHFYL